MSHRSVLNFSVYTSSRDDYILKGGKKRSGWNENGEARRNWKLGGIEISRQAIIGGFGPVAVHADSRPDPRLQHRAIDPINKRRNGEREQGGRGTDNERRRGASALLRLQLPDAPRLSVVGDPRGDGGQEEVLDDNLPGVLDRMGVDRTREWYLIDRDREGDPRPGRRPLHPSGARLHRRDIGSKVQERVPRPDRRGDSIWTSNRQPPPRLFALEDHRSRLLGRHVLRLPRDPRFAGEPRLADEQESSGGRVEPMDPPSRMGIGDERVLWRFETRLERAEREQVSRSVVQTLFVPAPRVERLVLRLSILRIKLGRRSRRSSPRGNVRDGQLSLRHFDHTRAEIDHELGRLPPDNEIPVENFDLQLWIGHSVFSVRVVAHRPLRLTLVMVEGYLLARLFRLVGDRSVTYSLDPQRRIVLGQVEKFRDRPRAGPLVSLLHRGHDRDAGIGGKDQGAGSLRNLQSVGDSRGCTLGPRVTQEERRDSAEDRRNVRIRGFWEHWNDLGKKQVL